MHANSEQRMKSLFLCFVCHTLASSIWFLLVFCSQYFEVKMLEQRRLQRPLLNDVCWSGTHIHACMHIHMYIICASHSNTHHCTNERQVRSERFNAIVHLLVLNNLPPGGVCVVSYSNYSSYSCSRVAALSLLNFRFWFKLLYENKNKICNMSIRSLLSFSDS